MRDPRIDPKEGDLLYEKGNTGKILIIDMVTEDYIYYRVTHSNGLLKASYCDIQKFKNMALEQCCAPGEENEKR